MAATAEENANENLETTYSTKRVLMRAEHQDELRMDEVSSSSCNVSIPEEAVVIRRDLTYYGPRLRVESLSDGEQYLLTVQGPESEATLWSLDDSKWTEMTEVSLDFGESIPQYDICLYCNEPLSTVTHRRHAVVGACDK